MRRCRGRAGPRRLRGSRASRDVTPGVLQAAEIGSIRSPTPRAEHIVNENARVEATVAALAAGDLDTVGRLFAESHASLRDLFDVSSPELDAMVEIATSVEGVVGARMTGAGFGGCTVNLVRPAAVEALRVAVLERLPGDDRPDPADPARQRDRRRRPDELIARHIGRRPAVSTLAATHPTRSAQPPFRRVSRSYGILRAAEPPGPRRQPASWSPSSSMSAARTARPRSRRRTRPDDRRLHRHHRPSCSSPGSARSSRLATVGAYVAWPRVSTTRRS